MTKAEYDIDQVEFNNGIQRNGNGIHDGGGGKDETDIAFVNDAYKQDDFNEKTDKEESSSSTQNGNSSSETTEENEEAEQAVTALEVFRYATGLDWLFMFIATIASIINGAIQPASFILFGEVINQFIDFESNEDEIDIEGELTFIAEVYVYAALMTIVTGYIGNTMWLYSSIRQTFVIRSRCFESIMRQDIGWFDTHDTGELSTRLSDDITKIQNGIGDKVGALEGSISMLVTGIVIGFVFSWKLTLVTIAMCPVLVVAAFITGKVISVITSQEQTAYAKAGSIAEEVLSSIRTVVAFGGEEKEIARYKIKLLDAEKAGIKKGISTGFAFGLFNAVIFCCCALGFWYGGVLVADDDLEGGDLLIVFFAIMIGASQFGQTGPNIEAFMTSRGAAFKIFNLIERQSPIDPMSTVGNQPPIEGVIEFQDVKFNYPSRNHIEVLKGLSLAIPKGTTCALVGESGCGKSTLIKLVQRFYDTKSGNVLVDGNDIKDINVRYLRKHIGVVSQEPVLFDTTIGENIKMGNDEATQEMIEEAAKTANAFNFINELPKKFDTFVGEGGAQLSGGQKQRIAIARALVRDPKILLLDEATSALDTESEAIIQAALEKAQEGRTTLVIAHRLSTVRNADMIAVVSEGRIVELGSHEELMKKRGEYFKLVMLQTFEEKAEQEEGESEEKGLHGIANEEEIDKIIRQNVYRSLSQISTKEEDVEALKAAFDRQHSHQLSLRKARKGSQLQKQVSQKEEELIEEEPENIPSFWRIIKLNLKEWPYMAVGMVFSAIAGGMPVAFAIILSEVLGSFAQTDQPQKMEHDSEFWSIQFMVCGFVIGLSYFIAQYLFAIAGEGLTTRLREMAFRALLRQEIAYFDLPQHSTGALTARLASDASAVQGATSTRLNTLTQVIVMGVTSLLIGFIYSWQLTLVILAMVPFMGFAGAMQTKLNTSFAADSLKYMDKAAAIATESIMQIRTVASLGKEGYFVTRYVNLLTEPTKKSKRNAHLFGISFGLSFGLILFADAASFRMGGYLAAEDLLSLADLLKVMMAVIFGSMTAGQLASFAPDYVKAKVAAGRILDLFDRVPPIDAYSDQGIKDELQGNIEFTDVRFHYPNRDNVPVLQGLNVKIEKGKTLAFVGASGCGKSTSVSLIERFYDTVSGVLEKGTSQDVDVKNQTLDGKGIKDFNVRHLRSELGIVQQEPVLFDCSIRDNILYGVDQTKEKITQQQIEKVAKDSNIHSFIINLPNGYDTNVGEKGTLISGGQKQRIAIARALIRNPKILLLDEATSALDSESEKIVQEALDVAMEGRTAVMIAHRLSTVQNADVIAVIQAGKVVEVGTHQELIAQKGAYFLLNQAQL